MTRNTRLKPGACFSCRSRRVASSLLGLGLLLSLGCFQPLTRPNTEEEGIEKILGVDTLGDITEVGNVLPLQVQGVGLVTGLNGTGGGTPPGELRKRLEDELRRLRAPYPKQTLDSPDHAMVLVTGIIPPGARRGDPFDVQINLPPGSKVTSLRGGYLQECYLRIYDTTKNLNPNFEGNNKVVEGHQLGKASGQLIVGLKPEGNEEPDLLSGVIWEGGVSFIDRPYYFLLKERRKLARVANAVAQRINTMFQDDPKKRQEVLRMKGLLVLDEVTGKINAKFNQSPLNNREMASAISKEMVAVNIPWEYRHNPQRFILVAHKIPLAEPLEKREAYRQRLKEMLNDPAHTISAAVRLEALGRESIPSLRGALQHEHPLVRFAASESLAYLGDSSGVSELAKLAEEHYQLRAYCLTALSSLEQTASRTRLAELLSCADSETRYGAFRGLQLLNVAGEGIAGEWLNNSFRLHRVARHSPGLVHYSLQRQAEVVLFGQDAWLVPPVRIMAGEFTITAEPHDQICTITRYQIERERMTDGQCSLRLEDVLRTMAAMGAEYPDVIEFLQRAEEEKRLNCVVCSNAVPQPFPVKELAKSGLDAKQWNRGQTIEPNPAFETGTGVVPAHYHSAVSEQ